MPFKLRFSASAARTLKVLEDSDPSKLWKVRRAFARLEQNPRYPGLASHQYESFPADRHVKVWDSYVESRTPSARRIFWRYGPNDGEVAVITVLAIGPHP